MCEQILYCPGLEEKGVAREPGTVDGSGSLLSRSRWTRSCTALKREPSHLSRRQFWFLPGCLLSKWMDRLLCPKAVAT